jgi:hypothetical protein
MLRRLIALLPLLLPLAGQTAGVWPEKWGEHTRVKSEPLSVADASLFSEYAGDAAERAVYSGPAGKFSGSAWRLRDSTGAFGWFQASRPDNCVPMRNNPLGCTTPGAQWMAHLNYVLLFEGWRPTAREMESLLPQLPNARSGGGLPAFAGFLPEKQRLRNSERFIQGPTSLQRFLPAAPVAAAGFEQGGEAQVARYRLPAGETTLALFYYPTPHVAREQAAGFQSISGWLVKRTGSYVVVVPQPPDQAQAEALLGQVNYEANLTINQPTKPLPMPNVAGMLIAIFELTGVLLLGCIGGGCLFAGLWYYLRRRDRILTGTESLMTTLDLRER